MPRPSFRLLPSWRGFALVLVLAVAACGDRGSGRPQAGEAAVPDTGAAVPQRTDTASAPVARTDTANGAAARAKAADTASAPVAPPPTERRRAAPTSASASPDTSAEAKAASLDSLHPFMPVTITLEVPPAPIHPLVLENVRAGLHPGFERVVFQMAGDTLPGYRIAYVEPPAVACGSGKRVSLAGEAVLVVRLQPARAHDDAGQPTVQERRQKPAFPVLKEMALTCDYEGQVQWALGLERRVPFRVLKLEHPARLVVDLQEGSG